MDSAGWVPAADVLNAGIKDGWILDEVEFWDLAAHDPKGRFEFSPDSWDGDDVFCWHTARMRACSGHSLDVSLDLDTYVPTADLFIAASEKRAGPICLDGLAAGSRRHVRLLESEETALAHGALMPGGNPSVLRIDAARMHADGFRFQIASNGEVLTSGVPAAYIGRMAPAGNIAPRA